jgi:hypothetical protein
MSAPDLALVVGQVPDEHHLLVAIGHPGIQWWVDRVERHAFRSATMMTSSFAATTLVCSVLSLGRYDAARGSARRAPGQRLWAGEPAPPGVGGPVARLSGLARHVEHRAQPSTSVSHRARCHVAFRDVGKCAKRWGEGNDRRRCDSLVSPGSLSGHLRRIQKT